MKSQNTFRWFRKIAWMEGVSYLILLGVAMPLKYLAGIPMAVTLVGSIHGALFIAFMIWMYLVYDQYGKNIRWMFKAFLASIIPFGTFWMDKEWKEEERNAVKDGQQNQN